jgi:hypothetical protein
VYRHELKAKRVGVASTSPVSYPPVWSWAINAAQPIHWIIAALIAKEMEEK